LLAVIGNQFTTYKPITSVLELFANIESVKARFDLLKSKKNAQLNSLWTFTMGHLSRHCLPGNYWVIPSQKRGDDPIAKGNGPKPRKG